MSDLKQPMPDSEFVKVKSVHWRGHLKELWLSSSKTRIISPLSACVSEGDQLEISQGRVFVVCKNGKCQIIEPYFQRVTLSIGHEQLGAAIKEITDEDEHEAYKALAEYHYRGHEIFGRTSRLALRVYHPSHPAIIGYVELASPLYMNKARSETVDTAFCHNGIRWEKWNKEAHRKYIHLFVRIARVVVSPEFRGLGFARLLVEHAHHYARSRWQVGGYLPYFMEISADMLKYVPFVEKAGMVKVGETEGNISRVSKDMDYLLRRFGRKKGGLQQFENSCGICDKQVSRLASAMRVIRVRGWSKSEFLQVLQSLSTKPTLKNLLLLGEIVSLPKPHYMSGLNAAADQLVRKRAQSIAVQLRKPVVYSERFAISQPIEFRNLSVKFRSRVSRTKRTFSVQHAFSVTLDQFETEVVRDLNAEIRPGEIVIIEGPSGSGKSTLLGLLSNNTSSASGSIVSGKVRIPQDARIGYFKPIRSKKPLIEIFGKMSVEDGINTLNIAGLSEAFVYLKRFSELSAGQQYRAMLAKLISSDTNVWLADEFCTNLDPVTSAIVAHNVQRYARSHGVTVIVAAPHSTHFLSSLMPDKSIMLTSLVDCRLKERPASNGANGNGTGRSNLHTLSIAPEYTDQILNKIKCSTIRRGHLNLSPGHIVLQSGQTQLAVRCIGVEYKKFGELTGEDALNDGFQSLSELKRALRRIYSGLTNGSEITLVHFDMKSGVVPGVTRMAAMFSAGGNGNGQH